MLEIYLKAGVMTRRTLITKPLSRRIPRKQRGRGTSAARLPKSLTE